MLSSWFRIITFVMTKTGSPVAHFNMKITSYQYRAPHGSIVVIRRSYNRLICTGVSILLRWHVCFQTCTRRATCKWQMGDETLSRPWNCNECALIYDMYRTNNDICTWMLTHGGQVTPYFDKTWVNIGSGDGLLPEDTKSWYEPMLTNHHWGLMPFT